MEYYCLTVHSLAFVWQCVAVVLHAIHAVLVVLFVCDGGGDNSDGLVCFSSFFFVSVKVLFLQGNGSRM